MKAFIKIIILGILCYTSFPVKTHLLEQSEEECKMMKLRVFNCEFKRIRKPNDTYSDFQYKFALSNYKIPSIINLSNIHLDTRKEHHILIFIL